MDEILKAIDEAKFIVSDVKKEKEKGTQRHLLQQVLCNKKHLEN